MISGKAWKFGDNISTDHITPGRYFHLRSNLEELAKHVLEDADPSFSSKVKAGDIIVAGRNFGLGSSREHAPRVIKIAGVSCIVAKSFARIFYRNSFNIGLPLLVSNTEEIDEGDNLKIDLEEGKIEDETKGKILTFSPLSPFMRKLIEDGGIEEHVKKHGDFKIK
ncbi:3-isopropylmalate dehydratase small subunit [candidate division WOR-3 bacterium]|nr:3-isopropylmalate dehydratase small subunit [candidate division WOR-3 bacterium]